MSLIELAVRDLALIERVRLTLAPGLTVITGETGAGKSLLIDALALVLGGRADSGLVRQGAERGRVEAVFERASEPLICVRELSTTGRSTARIDDETVTAGRLSELAAPLVEIHGQHEQQRLLSGAWQRELLDAFGGLGEARATVAQAVAALRANNAALRNLVTDAGELQRQIALHEHEADDIDAAGIRVGEVDELRAALASAGSAERISRLVEMVREELVREGTGARDSLARAHREGSELARLDARYTVIAERIAGLVAEAEDTATELRRLAAQADHDPQTVTAMEERLGRLYALGRRYGAGGDGEAALIAHGARARAQAEELRGQEAQREARTAARTRLEKEANAAAFTLSEGRAASAQTLSAAVTEQLRDLGFTGANLSVAVTRVSLGASGADAVLFLFAPNPGEPSLPLARIASGGELSRVSLAIKAVLAAVDTTPTLVFDEVDAGIGGRSADPVGRCMWRLARQHQVICVTHLPQIAAYADDHLRIRKVERAGRTVTEVDALSEAERVEELAAMLVGTAGDAEALAAASRLRRRALDSTAPATTEHDVPAGPSEMDAGPAERQADRRGEPAEV